MADATPNPEPRTPNKTSGVVIPHSLKWHGRLVAAAIYGVARGLSATLRFHWHDESGLFNGTLPQPAIFAIWHNRLALSMPIHLFFARCHGRKKLAALVSASRDGGLLARVLEHFDTQPVRGSSSRRGPQALRELTTWAERGYDLAITPDGPRGPRYVVQEGVLSLAQITGLPIVPVSYEHGWKWSLKSWDRFQIPLPFSRVNATLGAPLRVPRGATEEEREQLRLELERRLKEITRD
ncbi:MAG: lysophospholipid acyltransferase family protein [Verrucomicrobia bacterium]|nr:lysophospholipid acyltransferase family protein [Verrucomicrobiota bacterium]